MERKPVSKDYFLLLLLTVVIAFFVYKILQRVFNCFRTKSTPSPSQRRLGKFEVIMNILSRKRQGTGNICLIVTLQSKKKLVKDYVQKSLVMLAQRQPMLRAVIKTVPCLSNSEEESHFEIKDGNEVLGLINLTSSGVLARQWQQVWYEISAKPWLNGLLWRAVILQEEFLCESESYSNTLIFNFSHSCIDGVSTMKFCRQFLIHLNKAAQGSRSPEKISSLKLMQCLTGLLTNTRPWSVWNIISEHFGVGALSKFLLKKNLRHLLSTKHHNPYLHQLGQNRAESSSLPRSNIIFRAFNETETESIVKACRSNGATVTGALMAATHMAFCKLIDSRCSVAHQCQLEHGFSVNAQRHCFPKPDEEYLGQFALVPSLSMQYTNDEADFWSLARETTKRIHRLVKERKNLEEILSIFDAFSPEEFVEDILSPSDRRDLTKMANCNFVSSAGSFDFDEEENHFTYQLDDCMYNSLGHGFASTFAHFNTTVNGKMSWVILYDPSKVTDRKDAEKFSNLCYNYFVELSRGQ